jgi:hypothetical protein
MTVILSFILRKNIQKEGELYEILLKPLFSFDEYQNLIVNHFYQPEILFYSFYMMIFELKVDHLIIQGYEHTKTWSRSAQKAMINILKTKMPCKIQFHKLRAKASLQKI